MEVGKRMFALVTGRVTSVNGCQGVRRLGRVRVCIEVDVGQ